MNNKHFLGIVVSTLLVIVVVFSLFIHSANSKDSIEVLYKNLDTISLEGPAQQGDVDAQFDLGVKYYKGKGPLKDLKQAFYWFKKSAEKGNSASQYNLGVMYRDGEGALKDPKQAFYWFKKSAEQDNTKAQFGLGLMYFIGEGVDVNKKQSAVWMKKAYENGDNDAKEKWDELELWKY